MGIIGFTKKQFEAIDALFTEIKSRLAALEGLISGGSMQGYVDDWLDGHPEATTTVEDGSITAVKLNVDVTYTVTNGDLTISLT